MLFRAYRRQRLPFYLLFFIFTLLLVPRSVYAAGCTVPSATYPTIQTAVDAPECSRVLLATGTFTENIIIARTVNIIGAGEQESIIDGNHVGTAVTIQAGLAVKFKNLVIQNGNSGMGGGIFNDGSSLKLINVLMHTNINPATQGGSQGGAIYNQTGNVLLRDTVLQENGKSSSNGGAIYNHLGVITIRSSQILDNGFPTTSGGGIHNEQGTLIISNSTFNENFANDGATIFNNGGFVKSKQSHYIAGNGVHGSAVYNKGNAEFRSNGDTFANNWSIGLSSIFNNGGTVDLRNCLFENNISFGDGGAVHNGPGSNMTIRKCSFQNNTANTSNGGAIFNGAEMTVKNSVVEGNTAAFGGGIANTGTLTLKKIIFNGNIALAEGNDIWNIGTCTGCTP